MNEAARIGGRGIEIPLALRLRVYGLAVLLVFASVPFAHVYLAVDLSWGELLIHATDIALAAALAAMLTELAVSAWQRSWQWRIGSVGGAAVLAGAALFALAVGPMFGAHDLLPHTGEIRRKHVESGYAEMGLRILPVTALIAWLVYQATRMWLLRSELAEQRATNEALRKRAAAPPAGLDTAPGYPPIRLAADGGEVEIAPERIVRVQAQENYCEFLLAKRDGRRPLLVRMTLAEARERLPEALFVQTHRSHLANLRFVEELSRDGRNAALLLDGGDAVPIARSRNAEVRARVRQSLLA